MSHYDIVLDLCQRKTVPMFFRSFRFRVIIVFSKDVRTYYIHEVNVDMNRLSCFVAIVMTALMISIYL